MSAPPSATLFLFSGNVRKIREAAKLSDDTAVISFSEKQLMSFGATLRLMRSIHSDNIVFGAYSLNLQRYSGIISVLIFLSGKFHALFADESGKILRISPLKTLFIVIPSLLFEAAAGIAVAWFTIFRLFFRSK
ncbi:hypothetical protein MASR2M18_02080 [Ignavibacteria bacterium]|nr:hypothetical protein [Bacteroidota bacterium]MCZ2132596.1 hypothetical protein [Bacteroidota bacterium]